MKTIFVPVLLLLAGALAFSCADESAPYEAEVLFVKKNTMAMDAEYSLGEMHNILLSDYFSSSHDPYATAAEIDVEIGALMATYGLYAPSCGSTSCDDLIQQIVIDPIGFYNNYQPQSGLSSEAGNSFSTLLGLFTAANEDSLEQLVEQYAWQVTSSTSLSLQDKQVLLATCEIAQASLLFGKKRKDKDWETSVGNVVAALRGAGNGSAQALRLSLVTGIVRYNLNGNS